MIEASPDPFQVFDAHVHVGRWLTPDFEGRESDLADVTRVLRSAGITGALVMPTDAGDNEGLLREVVRHGETPGAAPALFFAAWVRPGDDSIHDFLQTHHSRVHALKIHPSFNRLPVTDPSFEPFLALASARRWPVVVHCGRWREVAGYERALDVAERHPDIPFILSHMGGDAPALVLGAARAVGERGLQNAFLGTESIREYWLVAQALDLVGPERLVFGSDHNLNHPASFLAVIAALDLAPAERSMVLGGNARRLLEVQQKSPEGDAR